MSKIRQEVIFVSKKFRPSAYPLITVDPYFSIWSSSDNLYDNYTMHWTGRPVPIYLSVSVDENNYRVCAFDEYGVSFRRSGDIVWQTGVKVTPTSTVYSFESDEFFLTVDFTTPLLLDRLDIFARPVSYIEYEVKRKDSKTDGICVKFGISPECCVNGFDRVAEIKNTGYSICCGNVNQEPLKESGDRILIDWGYLHLCEKDAYSMKPYPEEKIDMKTFKPYCERLYLTAERQENKGVFVVAYEEQKAIEYFNEAINEYYTKYFDSFEDMINAAKNEYFAIKKMCNDFDNELTKEAAKLGEDYKNIVTLAYRQAIASHKLIEDKEGNLIFLSKECNSNGCIGTLDVTYPSIPLFLKYNPELVLGMLRPIIKYANSDAWNFGFAPHDVGQYPLANGQVYGMPGEENQMPIEESGNMLLCVAAACKYLNDTSFFEENKTVLKKWADYLKEFGYDPGNQLCTDDFAGHLNHNCNLSIKAILGICAYGHLSGDNSYIEIAKEYAKKWEKEASTKLGTKLTFDNEDGWSLKYNMVWDNLLGYGIFSDEVKKNEIKLYKSKMNRYGVPLDSRKDYTKLDWLMWSTLIWKDSEYFNDVCSSVINMINETPDRVPLSDWYDTKTAIHCEFKNRTVVGGLFINMI